MTKTTTLPMKIRVKAVTTFRMKLMNWSKMIQLNLMTTRSQRSTKSTIKACSVLIIDSGKSTLMMINDLSLDKLKLNFFQTY